MKLSKLKGALIIALPAIYSVPFYVHSADFDVLGGTFHMGTPPSIIKGDGTVQPLPGYPLVGRMVTDSFTADYACADYNVTPVKAEQCENATNGTPGSPTASGPDDATASRNGLEPFNFFGSPTFTYFAATGVDFPSTPHPPPSIDVVAGTADMSSFYANWNGTEFHQGSEDPNNPKGGSTSDAVVTANPDGSYTISWSSLIVGGPFNGITGNWTVDVCPVPCELIPPAKAPSLEVEQNGSGVTTRTLIQGVGDAVISLDSGYDTTGITFNWADTDNVLDLGATLNLPTLTIPQANIDDPAALGLHRVVLVVTDTNYTPNRKANATLMLNVLPADPGVDIADTDNDGIPNFVDSITEPRQLQTDETTDTAWLMTVSDGILKLGDTAFCSERTAAGIVLDNIVNFGGVKCSSTTNYEDTTGTVQTQLGGIFDFEVHGLDNGQRVEVVIPLKEPIRPNASYRKYSPVVGWDAFDQSEGDSYQSAKSTATGVCPAHDESGWQDGLIVGNDCLKLSIADGGPNDTDNGADGIIKDPGAMSSNPDIDTNALDIGSLSWGIITGVIAWLGLMRRRLRNIA